MSTEDYYRALDQAEALTEAHFEEAFRAIEPRMTLPQRNMLFGHAAATAGILSMQAIAELGGYANYNSANTQYGRLGGYFAEYFGIQGLSNKVQAIASSDGERDVNNHFMWTVRPQLVKALRKLNLIPPAAELEAEDLSAKIASLEIDADPQCRGLPATQRKALVDARLGQGSYRQRMMKIWDSRCALTGLAVVYALIASHAKAWAKSSNEERLDPFNGLLLAASIDRLFDCGLISFANDGTLLLGEQIKDHDLPLLGISKRTKGLRATLDDRHLPYLQAHRVEHGFE